MHPNFPLQNLGKNVSIYTAQYGILLIGQETGTHVSTHAARISHAAEKLTHPFPRTRSLSQPLPCSGVSLLTSPAAGAPRPALTAALRPHVWK